MFLIANVPLFNSVVYKVNGIIATIIDMFKAYIDITVVTVIT